MKWCRHEWVIVKESNVIQQDQFGYPLMLCIQKCKKCGETRQAWIDISVDALQCLRTGELVLLEWREVI